MMDRRFNLPPLDLREWLAANPLGGGCDLPFAAHPDGPRPPLPSTLSTLTSTPSSPSLSPSPTDDRSNRIRRAISYLGAFSPAISGQAGHNQAFDAACALIKGFGLTVAEARPVLQDWNALCLPQWSAGELEHKLIDADKKPDDKRRGFLYDAESQARHGFPNIAASYASGSGGVNGISGANGAGGSNGDRSSHPQDMDGCPAGQEDDPHRLARLFVNSCYRHVDGIGLWFWREEFHAWTGSHYSPMPRKEVAAEITRSLESEFQRIYEQALMIHAMRRQRVKAACEGEGGGGGGESGVDGGKSGGKTKESGPPKKRPVTTRLVADVTQALSDLTLLRIRNCPDQPAWVDKDHTWPAHEILPTTNALVHLPSFIAGQLYMRPPTPDFFASYALAYPFDPESPEPVEWFTFLGQLWPDDPESIRTLQEWMGYLLTPDTSQQKILMLIGPKRSGKGTIIRVIRAMIGPDNMVNPTLSSLATNFGLAPLIGKAAGIITDARISGRTDTAAVIERLLSISGEDSQTIDRKHRDVVTAKLPTRFMVVSNELPKVRDVSGALAGRMVFLQLTRSFYGREDTTLFGRLLPELPGILLWAIQGWARLRERGHFLQPKSGIELSETMESLSSPIKSFLRDCCRVGPGSEFSVEVATLYQRWRNWCSSEGQENPGILEEFGKNLRAVLPELKKIHPRINGRRVWCYHGLRELEEWENNDEYEEKDGEGVFVDDVPF